MKDLQPITKQFITYNTKVDPSNSDQRFLTVGSKNVLISDDAKFASRQGFALQSAAGTDQPAQGSTEWLTSTNNDYALKAYLLDGVTTGVLTVLIAGTWETLMENLTSVDLIFSPYFDNTEKIDRLLWTDGSANLHDWSGASTSAFVSLDATTITIGGTQTFGQLRFLTTGTRAFRIKDDNDTWHRAEYTGGESTNTLTGLTVDLTAFPFSGGNLIVQEVVTRTNIPDSAFLADFLLVVDNQVWVGSRSSNLVYVSKNTSVADYTFSTPRAIGEGALLTLDGPGRALGTLKSDVILFAGKSLIYKSSFNQITVGVSLAETLKVERLKTTNLQSALHQNLVENLGNGLVWIGYDNVLHKLIDATLAYNPDLRDESDPIKPDFDATDFTGGDIRFFKNRIHISAPASATNFIQEYRLVDDLSRQWFWQPPQSMPVNRWAVIDDVLCGHSSATNETYTLFTGYNDNSQAIHCVATLARWNGGIRDMLKNAAEFFNEGDITANTVLAVKYLFNEDGGENSSVTKTINGDYADIIFPTAADDALGNITLGDVSLTGDVTGEDSIRHFRVIDDLNETEFFDYAVLYETNEVDYRWAILCHGNNASLASGKPTAIKNNN